MSYQVAVQGTGHEPALAQVLLRSVECRDVATGIHLRGPQPSRPGNSSQSHRGSPGRLVLQRHFVIVCWRSLDRRRLREG